MIAQFKIKVDLKPKGKWGLPLRCTGGAVIKDALSSPKLMMILADLKFGDRDITESCLVFLYPKDGEASGEPQLSSSTKLYLKLYKLI